MQWEHMGADALILAILAMADVAFIVFLRRRRAKRERRDRITESLRYAVRRSTGILLSLRNPPGSTKRDPQGG
jgi:hypothetical protein